MLLFKATVCYYFILWSCWNQLQIETQTLFWSSESSCWFLICVCDADVGPGPDWTGVSRGRPSSRIIDMLSVCLSSGPTITQRSDPCVCVCVQVRAVRAQLHAGHSAQQTPADAQRVQTHQREQRINRGGLTDWPAGIKIMIKCHGHLSKTKDFLGETLNHTQKTKSSNKISEMLRDIDPGTDRGRGYRGRGYRGDYLFMRSWNETEEQKLTFFSNISVLLSSTNIKI